MRAVPAAVLALAPAMLAAQDGQFDLRTRAAPTPTPTSRAAGPADPDSPAPVRPRSEPSATTAPPPPVAPSAAPPAAASTTAPPVARATVRAAPRAEGGPPQSAAAPPSIAAGAADAAPRPQTSASPPIAPPSASAATPYQPRNLDLVDSSRSIGWWLALAAAAFALEAGAWLAWSRWFKVRVVALPAPEIERPRVPQPAPAPLARAPEQPVHPVAPVTESDLAVSLDATRLSATLMNTTLSYRLTVANNGREPLRNIRVDGDMIAAHASLRQEPVIGRNAAVLPSLHQIATLAPGESVTLGGDIRLPLVAITPIRRGDAAFFVPLARLRARGTAPTGVTVEGGGTFLVGQEPGANRKLQPFRLDLGPRNYSNLGQQLLSAA